MIKYLLYIILSKQGAHELQDGLLGSIWSASCNTEEFDGYLNAVSDRISPLILETNTNHKNMLTF